MMPKVKTPKPPPEPASAVDIKTFNPKDETSRSYGSLVSTAGGIGGLKKSATTVKKSLLGGLT